MKRRVKKDNSNDYSREEAAEAAEAEAWGDSKRNVLKIFNQKLV